MSARHECDDICARYWCTDPGYDQCNTLFCVAEKHEDDQHVDVTGHSWREPLSDCEVIAHVYDAS